jgi:signal transduction histidine kinase
LPIDTDIQPLRTDHDLILVRWSDASLRLAAEASKGDARELHALTEERERVARDLHDTVIQQLFATGLALMSTAERSSESAIAERVNKAVDEIDGAIRQLRTAIFASNAGRPAMAYTTCQRLLTAIAEEAGRMFQHPPSITIDAAVDAAQWHMLHLDLAAVLRECLANIARHANALDISVVLSCGADRLDLCVSDDGQGVDLGTTYRSGIANMRVRAEQHGGTFRLNRRTPRGTSACWSVPAAVAG